jgi:hypothetical protein
VLAGKSPRGVRRSELRIGFIFERSNELGTRKWY